MHVLLRLSIAATVVAAGTAITPLPASAATLTRQFNIEVIHGSTDGVRDHGVRPSMEIEPSTGRPVIAWYEGTYGGLHMAFPVPRNSATLGSCNAGGTTEARAGYHCLSPDTGGRAGFYSAMAWDTTTPELLHTFYSDPETAEIRVTRFWTNGNMPIYNGTDVRNPPKEWDNYIPIQASYVTAASNGDSTRTFVWRFSKHVSLDMWQGGLEAAFARDDSGLMQDGFERDVNVPYTIGAYPSLRWSPANGTWTMAYRGGSGVLRFTEQKGNNEGCSSVMSPNSWRCSTVDPTTVAYGISLHAAQVGGVDPTRISYYHSGSGNLRVATYVGGSGNCGAGGAAGWSCENIDAIAAPGTAIGIHTSIVMRGNVPHIAYSDHNNGSNSIIKLARRVGSGGNCGAGVWQCDVIASVAGENLETPVMKASVNGRLFIAWHNATRKRLELASEKYGEAPLLTKAYAASTVAAGGVVTATYTLKNMLPTSIAASFGDTLLSGQTLAGPVTAQGGCTTSELSQSLSSVYQFTLNARALGPGATCTIRVPVRATKAGVFYDATTPVISPDTVLGNGAGATLTVTAWLPPPVQSQPGSRAFVPTVAR